MRILWDCRCFADHMGGIAHAAAGWLEAFIDHKPKGWSVVVMVSSACGEQTLARVCPFDLSQVRIEKVDAGFIAPRFEQLHLPTLLERLKIDLYFNPGFTIPAIASGPYLACVIHDVVFFDQPQWVEPRLLRYLADGTDLAMCRADLVYTVSNYSKERICSVAGERDWPKADRVRLLRPAVSTDLMEWANRAVADDEVSDQWRDKLPREFLLYLGAIEQKKGASFLLDAYGQLLERTEGRAPRLILAGGVGGQAFDLDAAIGQRGLSQSVIHLGAVNESQKRWLMSRAKVFVFPSLYEGFGIPPLEAMALGTPVVATDATSLPEVLGDAAEYVQADDIDGLARCMETVISDDPRYKIYCSRDWLIRQVNWPSDTKGRKRSATRRSAPLDSTALPPTTALPSPAASPNARRSGDEPSQPA